MCEIKLTLNPSVNIRTQPVGQEVTHQHRLLCIARNTFKQVLDDARSCTDASLLDLKAMSANPDPTSISKI